MGRVRPEREVASARGRYHRALQRLHAAMDALFDHDVPLDEPEAPWTREHVQVVMECAEAWPALIDARRTYDRLRMEAGMPHSAGVETATGAS